MSDDLNLDDFVCFALYTANHAMNRVYKPLLDALDLTYPQYLVMVTLWKEDGQTVGGIGGKLLLESSTLTPLLKRLEAIGYIKRERGKDDERVVIIRLTGQGRELRKRAAAIPRCIAEASGREFAELKRLGADVIALRDALQRKTA
ncbi:MarR family winged helix-turn-helix transcriptional regulator [Rhizobium sp. LjRoot258]|uniref:MarR family winged helix-turn-helix transcriptional regulator n=1 Tax=Rhizobium sp. LjRoot258 TaxID=3342299 RepID=UPI003ECE8E3A